MCLGVVLGWLVRFFLARLKQFNVKVLSSVASILCGGEIVRILPDPFQYAWWFYPVGLLIGILRIPLDCEVR
jgi:hypothetical protein